MEEETRDSVKAIKEKGKTLARGKWHGTINEREHAKKHLQNHNKDVGEKKISSSTIDTKKEDEMIGTSIDASRSCRMMTKVWYGLKWADGRQLGHK